MILTIEPLLFAINALPKSLLIPTETRILRWFGYISVVIATNNLLAAIKLSILVVGILYGVDVLEAKFKSLSKGVHRHVKIYSKRYYRGNKKEQERHD